MSVIYYCDAPSCGKKLEGTSDQFPIEWNRVNIEGKRYDACTEEHASAIKKAFTPQPVEEENGEAKAEE